MDKPHFKSLDSLRGAAALGIVFLHIEWTYPGFHLQIIRHLGLMVDFFFVLSGFVISFNYLGRITRNTKTILHFLWLRFWRLYPLHFVMLIVFLGIECSKYAAQILLHVSANYPAFQTSNFNAFVMNLLLAQSLHTTTGVSFNEPSWSISTEFYTYLLFALVAAALNDGLKLLLAALAIMAASLCLLLLAPAQPFALECTSHFGIFRCTLGFFTGVAVFFAYRALRERAARFNLEPAAWLTAAAIFLILIAPDGYIDLSIYPAVALLILLLALHREGRMHAILNTRPLLWLGRISYSIYMVHYAVTWTLAQILRFGFHAPQINIWILDQAHPITTPSAWLGTAFAWLAVGMTLLLSQLTYTWIEEPWRLWSKRWRGGLTRTLAA